MIPVRIHSQAAQDLLRIADHLSLQTDSGEIGQNFLDAADETAHLLANAPLIGRSRSSRNPHLATLRSLPLKRPFHRYLFYYQVSEVDLTVVRVLHTAQDVYRLLSVEPETNG